MRRLSLRAFSGLTVAFLSLLALLAAVLLIVATNWMRSASERLVSSTAGTEVARAIEADLLLHESLERLPRPRSEIAAPLAAVESRLRRELIEAEATVDSDGERALLAELTSAIEAYLAADLGARGGPFSRALALTENYLALNLEHVRGVEAAVLGLGRSSTMIGGAVIAALALVAAVMLAGGHYYVYRPLAALTRALRRFSAGEAARVEEGGLRELQEIGRAFNEMAAELARQRAERLRFIAAVAHDLRNPLAALKATTDAFAAGRLPEAKLARFMGLAGRQVGRLNRMVSDLLDAAQIEAGRLAIRPVEHDLRELAREAVELFAATSPVHELALSQPPAPVVARCDPARIAQVINNLLSNAIKYSPDGGRVEVALGDAAGEAVLAVTDQGVGIPAEEQEHIFRPFRRASSAGGDIPGVGLGLAVASRIAAAHGGRIEVESAVGAGSTFRLFLPLAQAPARRGAPRDGEAAPPT
jgi:signal transduction histidine kinase